MVKYGHRVVIPATVKRTGERNVSSPPRRGNGRDQDRPHSGDADQFGGGAGRPPCRNARFPAWSSRGRRFSSMSHWAQNPLTDRWERRPFFCGDDPRSVHFVFAFCGYVKGGAIRRRILWSRPIAPRWESRGPASRAATIFPFGRDRDVSTTSGRMFTVEFISSPHYSYREGPNRPTPPKQSGSLDTWIRGRPRSDPAVTPQ